MLQGTRVGGWEKRISLRRFVSFFDDGNKAATKHGPANTQIMATVVSYETCCSFIRHDINNANANSAQVSSHNRNLRRASIFQELQLSASLLSLPT
jgi:hypothetical protein